MATVFQVTRIYSDEKGESHFEDVEIPLQPAGDIGSLSEALTAKSIIFREVLPSYDYDFHNAPQKQYIILLDGGFITATTRRESILSMIRWLTLHLRSVMFIK